jgi:hypothetical protein
MSTLWAADIRLYRLVGIRSSHLSALAGGETGGFTLKMPADQGADEMRIFTILALAACSAGKGGENAGETGKAESEETQQETETGMSEGEEEVRPFIVQADAWCYVAATGEESDQWVFHAIADDPQGAATLDNFFPEGIAFQNSGGSTIETIAIVCTEAGECTSSTGGDALGAGCSQAESFKATFIVRDEDENFSDPVTVDCRAGDSASG